MGASIIQTTAAYYGVKLDGTKLTPEQAQRRIANGQTNIMVSYAGAMLGGMTPEVHKGTSVYKVINSTETQASVDKKLETYLLDKSHPTGGSKANWFEQALGFNKSNMRDLSKQIIFDAKVATQTEITQYGTKFNQVIKITGENGKNIDVTFVWIKNNDGIVRLVTAIPTKK